MHKTRMIRTMAIASIILAAAGAITGCSGSKKDKDAANGNQIVFAVTTTTATKGELKDYLEFGGDVSAKTNVDVLPDTSGKIAEVKVRIGDTVEKNQVIALVDPSRPGMNYEPSPVKAPISGTVTAVNVVAGSMVSPQMSVARVSKTETLQIGMNVPERYVSKIKTDQSAWLRFDAYPGEAFAARISEISPVLDPTSRTMAVKLALERSDSRIKAGMFARVKLITDTRSNIVKIPGTAVVTRFGESYVFVVRSSTVTKQAVKEGIRVNDKTEILSGLNPGDEIVIRGQTLLEDGSLVNVISRVEPLPATESLK